MHSWWAVRSRAHASCFLQCHACAQASTALAVVRICLPVAPNQAVQQACTTLLNRQAGSGVEFACVLGGSGSACIEQVAQGSAELTKFGGERAQRGAARWIAPRSR